MHRGKVDIVQVFEIVLGAVLLLAVYGWYLMFDLVMAGAYGVAIGLMMVGYYYVTYVYY